MMRVLTDHPITRREDDELGSVEFARRLVRPLVEWPAQDSLVMGIFAPWGQGKSSTLNLLELELSHWGEAGTRRAVPVRFNPWLYSDTTTLLTSFFGTMADALGTSWLLTSREKKALRKAIQGFGKYVVPVLSALPATTLVAPIAKAAGATFEKLLQAGEGDLAKERGKIRNALSALSDREQPVRVVVLIDDLDRVEDDELRAMLRLVKLVGDLPNVSYVLALDFGRVREVLAGGKALSYGQAFLEKIFQVPIYLPPISIETLEVLSKTALREVLEQAGLASDIFGVEQRQRLLPEIYHKTVARGVLSLRDRARLVNTLRFMLLADTTPRLHPLDAVLIAFLQAFYPDAYDRVRRNKGFLTEGRGFEEIALGLGRKREEVQANRKRLFLKVVSGLENFDYQVTPDDELQRVVMTKDQVSVVEQILQSLFPRAVSGEDVSFHDRTQLRIDNRIQVPERFDRYFQLRPPPDEVSDEYVEDFLGTLVAMVSESDAQGQRGVLALFDRLNALGPAQRASLVSKLTDRLAQIPPQLAMGIGDALLDAQEQLPAAELLEMEHLLFERAYKIAGADGRSNVEVDTVVSGTLGKTVERLSSAPDAVLFAARHVKDSDLALRLSDVAKKDLTERGLVRMRTYVSNHANIFQQLGAYEGGEVVWRWRDLLVASGQNTQEIKDYLRRLVEADLGALPDVLSLLAGWSFGDVPTPGMRGTQAPREIKAAAEQIFGFSELQNASLRFAAKTAELADRDRYGLVQQFLEILPPHEQADGTDSAVPPAPS